MKISVFLVLLSSRLVLAAEPQMLFFAKETAKEFTHVALRIEGDQVTGTQVWQPREAHGAAGTLDGILTGGGIIQVVYQYTIEGSEQEEEQVFKLEGDKLYPGEGELVEGEGGRLNLKAPNQVEFKTALAKVAVTEPKAGSPERKAIMDAMRVVVTEHVGTAVTFTGDVRTSGGWARFQGNVATANGKVPTKEEAAMDLELDFFALLKKDGEGNWGVVHWGFAGDIGVSEEAKEKFPEAPWVLYQ